MLQVVVIQDKTGEEAIYADGELVAGDGTMHATDLASILRERLGPGPRPLSFWFRQVNDVMLGWPTKLEHLEGIVCQS